MNGSDNMAGDGDTFRTFQEAVTYLANTMPRLMGRVEAIEQALHEHRQSSSDWREGVDEQFREVQQKLGKLPSPERLEEIATKAELLPDPERFSRAIRCDYIKSASLFVLFTIVGLLAADHFGWNLPSVDVISKWVILVVTSIGIAVAIVAYVRTGEFRKP